MGERHEGFLSSWKKSWRLCKISQWHCRTPLWNQPHTSQLPTSCWELFTDVPILSHALSEKSHCQSCLHLPTLLQLLFFKWMEDDKNAAWLGRMSASSGNPHKHQMSVGRRSRDMRTHLQTWEWQWATNQTNVCKETHLERHSHDALWKKWWKKNTFEMVSMQNRQNSLVPLQLCSWARFYFKGMCNLSKASWITHVLRVKHRLKIAALAVGSPGGLSSVPSELLLGCSGVRHHRLGGMTEPRVKQQSWEKTRGTDLSGKSWR